MLRGGKPTLALSELDQSSVPTDSHEGKAAARLIVHRALNRLPDSTRLTVTLSYIDGYSHAEVANFLNVPVNTVRSRLQHAKRQLREEMLTMVSDTLGDGKAGPEFTKRVVEEALRQAHDARKANATGAALRHYDEALAALDQAEPSEDQLRRKMNVLWEKGDASKFCRGYEQAIEQMNESLSIAAQLGDRSIQADRLQYLGVIYSNAGRNEKAEETYLQALELYRELGDRQGQGLCLMWLGSGRVFAQQPEPILQPFVRRFRVVFDVRIREDLQAFGVHAAHVREHVFQCHCDAVLALVAVQRNSSPRLWCIWCKHGFPSVS
jgi:tetratricopeptide (TPR) repeat protein